VERETVRAEAALALGDSLRVEATAYETRADSLAVAAARIDTVVQERIVALPTPPPDCEPFTAPRDSVILLQEERHDSLSLALEDQRTALDHLRRAEAAARTAGDSLLAVLEARPRPLSPLIPSVGLGCSAGLSVTRAMPDAVCGLTLSWEVNLF
jgi:hypothetical protein